MKVRVGFGLGNLRPADGETLGTIAEALERLGYDSLWCTTSSSLHRRRRRGSASSKIEARSARVTP
ncbi:MAG: hypothetical protein ACKOOG_10630, partial [Actinomycetota bacterium]